MSALVRPTRSTGAILRLLNSLSEEVKGSLFGDTNQTETTQHETLRDLRRIVNQHFEAPHRLATPFFHAAAAAATARSRSKPLSRQRRARRWTTSLRIVRPPRVS